MDRRALLTYPRRALPAGKRRRARATPGAFMGDDAVPLVKSLQANHGGCYSAVTPQTEGRAMGEWSEYFDDFPEENPANYVGTQFDPKGAAALRATGQQRNAAQVALDGEIAQIVEKHRAAREANARK